MTTNCIAEVELTYKTRVKASERPQIKASRDAFELLYLSWNLDSIEHVEEFKIILLNRSNKVLGIATISKGGMSGTVIDIKLIFQYAIKSNASAIILAHNHPSGKKEPSESDISITKRIKEAGNIMDLKLLDHIILIPEAEFYSMADNEII
jgi:DNA repair protein RadC